jgi:hypothetical protein
MANGYRQVAGPVVSVDIAQELKPYLLSERQPHLPGSLSLSEFDRKTRSCRKLGLGQAAERLTAACAAAVCPQGPVRSGFSRWKLVFPERLPARTAICAIAAPADCLNIDLRL